MSASVDPVTQGSPDAAMSPAQAAAFLGLTPKTLANWRFTNQGPAYLSYGSRRVMYLHADLVAFREAHRISHD